MRLIALKIEVSSFLKVSLVRVRHCLENVKVTEIRFGNVSYSFVLFSSMFGSFKLLEVYFDRFLKFKCICLNKWLGT